MNIEEEQAIEMLEFIKEHNSLIGYKLRNRECLTEFILNELDKKDKVIDTMAEYIEECTGSCPNDMYDWQEIDCDKECEISMKKCWIEYFYKKVEIPEEN